MTVDTDDAGSYSDYLEARVEQLLDERDEYLSILKRLGESLSECLDLVDSDD